MCGLLEEPARQRAEARSSRRSEQGGPRPRGRHGFERLSLRENPGNQHSSSPGEQKQGLGFKVEELGWSRIWRTLDSAFQNVPSAALSAVAARVREAL